MYAYLAGDELQKEASVPNGICGGRTDRRNELLHSADT